MSPVSGGLRVVRVNEAARRRGVRAGQTSAEAGALAPGLAVHAEDAAGDRRALERLAAWADCLSPVVHISGDDGLLVDVTDCARVFGGEDRLGQRAVAGLAEFGFTSWAAIADTPGAAWALAHGVRLNLCAAPEGPYRQIQPDPLSPSNDRLIICPPGRTAAALTRLPVWALRVDAAAADGLRRVGVETIETLLHLPRSSVAKRFGEGVLHRLDQALGDAPELLDPFRAPPAVCARVGFIDATDRWEHVREAVLHGLAQVCAELERRVAGVRRLHVTFHLSRDPVAVELDAERAAAVVEDSSMVLELSRATRDERKLAHLVDVKLEGLRLPAAVEGVSVWSRALEGLDGTQQTWFDTQAQDAAALGDLLDRLALRLGRSRVVQPRLMDEHAPERAYAYAPAGIKRGRESFTRRDPPLKKTPDPFYTALSCRPVRLLRAPAAIEVLALLPDGPVLRFRWAGRDHTVARWAGPERVETGWWRGRRTGMRRDYYRVEDETGRRYWVFKDIACGRWFLHGTFD